MAGKNAGPPNGKTARNRNKPKHPNREALGKGQHKPGSQNRNKSGRGNKP